MDRLKQHDLLPKWRGRVLDGNDPVDLSTAVAIKVYGRRNGTLVINYSVPTPFSADGWVEMAWPAGSTDEVGYIDCEVEVVWPGPKPQTFPPEGYLRTTIYRDLA